MNPRQAVTSFCSAATGILALLVSAIYLGKLPDSAVKAKELVTVLIVYGAFLLFIGVVVASKMYGSFAGILQVLLATTFFATCMQTSLAVSKGVKDAFQIVVGLLVALSYLAITFISTIVGVFGELLALFPMMMQLHRSLPVDVVIEFEAS